MAGLDDLIKSFNKDAKETIIQYGMKDFECERIPFTSPRMNYCTFGGLPVGRLIEFYGEEHGGKTTSALDIVGNFQRIEREKVENDPNYISRKVLYLDIENTLDTAWARKLGVDTDDLVLFSPTTQSAEDIFQFIINAVITDEIGLWVLDSIPAMASEKEWEKDMDEVTVAGISKQLTTFARKVEQLMKKHHVTGIGINQVRDKIGAQYPTTVTPGGKAWKHFCSVRIEFRAGDYIDENGKALAKSKSDTPSGRVILMSMVKNKSCPPTRRTGSYTINFKEGIDYIRDVIDLGMIYGAVNKAGAWFDIVDIDTGEVIESKIHGDSALHDYLEQNLDVLERLDAQVMARMSMA